MYTEKRWFMKCKNEDGKLLEKHLNTYGDIIEGIPMHSL
jgi:hypothetical protein